MMIGQNLGLRMQPHKPHARQVARENAVKKSQVLTETRASCFP